MEISTYHSEDYDDGTSIKQEDQVEEEHHHLSDAGPTSAAAGHDTKSAAQRAFLAHAAPHVFSSSDSAASSAASSRSPSPSRGGSGGSSSTKRKVACTKHTVPPNFRGPIPRDSDPEEVAPLPSLQLVSGSFGSDGSQLFTTPNTAFNRNGWRYTFAGPSTQTLPYLVYRNIPAQPQGVHWDWSDRSVFTHISRDARIVSADKGWRAARANIPVREGSWYCEVEILPPAAASAMKDGSHVRLGWGRREAPLNAPVGFDAYSYGLRDATGQRVFLSRPSEYGQPFKAGDVVGMYIHIPPLSKANMRDARDPRHVRRKRIPIRYRGQMYFEQLEYAHAKEMEHLVERSWKGEQLTRSDGTIGCMGNERGLDVQSTALSVEEERRVRHSRHHKSKHPQYDVAPSNPTAPPGMSGAARSHEDSPDGPVPSLSTKSKQKGVKGGKKRKGGMDSDKDSSGKSSSAFRPLPTLGPDSRIGFFVNGKPLGWAFRDLLDFRPLRASSDPSSGKASADALDAPGTSSKKKSKKTKRPQDEEGATAGELSMLAEQGAISFDPDEISALTTSASQSAIMKSRENIFDDGSTGYFPFASMYGGARVKLKTQVDEFSALPDSVIKSAVDGETTIVLEGMEEALDSVSSDSVGENAQQPIVKQEGADMAADPDVKPSLRPLSRTQPLCDLYQQYWTAQHLIDISEEERAKMSTQYLIAKYGENYGRDESDEEDQHPQQQHRGESSSASMTPEVGLPANGKAMGKKSGKKQVGQRLGHSPSVTFAVDGEDAQEEEQSGAAHGDEDAAMDVDHQENVMRVSSLLHSEAELGAGDSTIDQDAWADERTAAGIADAHERIAVDSPRAEQQEHDQDVGADEIVTPPGGITPLESAHSPPSTSLAEPQDSAQSPEAAVRSASETPMVERTPTPVGQGNGPESATVELEGQEGEAQTAEDDDVAARARMIEEYSAQQGDETS